MLPKQEFKDSFNQTNLSAIFCVDRMCKTISVCRVWWEATTSADRPAGTYMSSNFHTVE